ncbi:AAA family ATPase [Chromobacterium sp. ATCC 53434]|uniref:AAA family ATPase n=1 Tax=Chromobacterium sp. (strain ATCC 53434 / SC 14030) TaxID=2059672 RepID=UPI001F20C4C2|nr:AAA family ATPase [Chromobacterium sp. ATCC 53434]
MQLVAGVNDIYTGKGRANSRIDIDIEIRKVERSFGGDIAEVVSGGAGKIVGERSIWGTNPGWFSASFGPFRRFSGGDASLDRLFYSNPKLAPHLSAFGEDVALTEGLRWLSDLKVRQLENNYAIEGRLLDKLIEFLNGSKLLPHGSTVSEVTSDAVRILDASGALVRVDQMSDGYRSVLSMIFEIFRLMTKSYGMEKVISSLNVHDKCLELDGVVAIDEVDTHLHPSWQKKIGLWFKSCFPRIQFIVSTHSPIICQGADSVWYLPNPGSNELSRRIQGTELSRLVYGSIMDAYGTEFFGVNVTRSEASKEMLQELAVLNRKSLRGELSEEEQKRLLELSTALPTASSTVAG